MLQFARRAGENRARTDPFLSLMLLIALVLPAGLWADDLKGIHFEPTYETDGASMHLQGLGLKTVFMMKAFIAGFYWGSDTPPTDPLADVPKHLDVAYFVKISARDLTSYTISRMKANVTPAEFEKIKDRADLMGIYFVNLKNGDRFSLTYIPGMGTKFAHNGRVTGTIEGEDFAKGLFAVWLGAKPFDKNLKLQILGLKKPDKGSKH